jgi:hypothetical protein
MNNEQQKVITESNEIEQKTKTSNKNFVKILIISLLTMFVIGGLYSIYYFLLAKDEYSIYFNGRFTTHTMAQEGDFTSIELYVDDYDNQTCELTFSNLSIKETLQLPCKKLLEENYDGEGYYTLYLSFNTYPLLPDMRQYLKNWKLLKADNSRSYDRNTSKESYIQGIKSLLGSKTILETHSCLLLSQNSEIGSWSCNSGTEISAEYLQAIYLLHQLGKQLEDEDILLSVKDEIAFLNSNYSTTEITFGETPSAYLLVLAQLGLNQEFLEGIESFNLMDLDPISLEIPEKEPLLITEDEVFSNEYLLISQFASNALIYDEYEEYTDLYEYNRYRMIEEYMNSDYVLNGLCSIAYATEDEELFSEIKPELEDVISNSKNALVLNNLVEMYRCKLLGKNIGQEIEGLNEAINNFVQNSTITNESGSYIVNISRGETENVQFIKFRLIDNLMYLLYE